MKETIYAVAYRPLHDTGSDRIETWPVPLAIGESLPKLPLSLEAEHCVGVDFESVYAEACRRRRLDEV